MSLHRLWRRLRRIATDAKVLLLLALNLLATYLMALAQVFADNHARRSCHDIEDVMHAPIGESVRLALYPWPDYLLLAHIVLGVGVIFASRTPRRNTRTALAANACLFFMRSLTVRSTILPSLVGCVAPENQSIAPVEALKILAKLRTTCTDYVFSGHTTTFSIMALAIAWFARSVWPVVVSVLLASTGIALIILSRFHYTVDVILAIIVTGLLWLLLHQPLAQSAPRHHPRPLHWLRAVLVWLRTA